MVREQDCIAIFHSIHRVLKVEQLLKHAGVAFLLIPVPRKLTADCGLAVRVAPQHLAAACAVLAAAELLPAELYQLRAGEFVAIEPATIPPSPPTT
jgi:hypothetical protein